MTAPVNGSVTLTGLTLGETATYSCGHGHTLSGEVERTCGHDGTWSGSDPVCQLTSNNSFIWIPKEICSFRFAYYYLHVFAS